MQCYSYELCMYCFFVNKCQIGCLDIMKYECLYLVKEYIKNSKIDVALRSFK